MKFKDVRDVYWKYYIALENQFMETARYVEFDYVNNGKTYSIEFLKLFQAVCSEIDVVGKQLASIGDASFTSTKNTGINEWWYHVIGFAPELMNRMCNLFGERDLQPWKGFKVVKNENDGSKKYILDVNCTPKAKTPTWWNDYNSAKHNRTGSYERHSTNYAKANLRNLLSAFAALYALEVQLLIMAENNEREKLPTNLESRLFKEDLPFYTYLLSVS